jgi:putative FmdB family regulatory protein
MPTYDYLCEECGNTQEEIHSISVTPTVLCETCSSKCVKQFSPSTNFVLKGSDWTSYNSRIKNSMNAKNKKLKSTMKERTASGEAVTTLGQLKNKTI